MNTALNFCFFCFKTKEKVSSEYLAEGHQATGDFNVRALAQPSILSTSNEHRVAGLLRRSHQRYFMFNQ